MFRHQMRLPSPEKKVLIWLLLPHQLEKEVEVGGVFHQLEEEEEGGAVHQRIWEGL